jgi:hypothetical protein
MLSERFSIAWKIVLGIVPICYAGMIIATLPNTFLWIMVVASVLVPLMVLLLWLDCPLYTVWPVIPGATVLVAGSLALLHDGTGGGPVTSNSYELWSIYIIAILLILWGIYSTWMEVQMTQRL